MRPDFFFYHYYFVLKFEKPRLHIWPQPYFSPNNSGSITKHDLYFNHLKYETFPSAFNLNVCQEFIRPAVFLQVPGLGFPAGQTSLLADSKWGPTSWRQHPLCPHMGGIPVLGYSDTEKKVSPSGSYKLAGQYSYSTEGWEAQWEWTRTDAETPARIKQLSIQRGPWSKLGEVLIRIRGWDEYDVMFAV